MEQVEYLFNYGFKHSENGAQINIMASNENRKHFDSALFFN